ncbi:MAG: AAA family ATPase [Lachnospiraceae bacterium]|nr:AAA family ATPase [Lachnospiraceae bacterium]
MNIAQAKQSIKDTIKLYLKKDELGDYILPMVRQRPVFLLGAPGIGKTAIIEQIAAEMGLALVSYSMTHHTRQSALGLPFIEKKDFGGKEYSVSEYTMSEIIASVYDTIEESGIKEGILFLDEINCVSETLYPSMLQFLQYKVFGRHKVPDGWVVVTAGNPPEYNRMVREFDVVTMDRLKLMEVEADKKAWMDYALKQQVHPAILSYLELKDEHFYIMELTEAGREYVTARGWEDLSRILKACEEEGIEADEILLRQYLHHDAVVREFAAFYELYRKYEKDYSPARILKGEGSDMMIEKIAKAPFDERILLAGMLCERVEADMQHVLLGMDALGMLRPVLASAADIPDVESHIKDGMDALNRRHERMDAAGALKEEERRAGKRAGISADKMIRAVRNDPSRGYEAAKGIYNEELKALKEEASGVQAELSAMFAFSEAAFGGEGQELLLLISRLTVNDAAARFLAVFGSEDYARLSSVLMVRERGEQLKDEIKKLVL